MTKTNTASSGPVYGLSVPGCQLKKVRRRSVRLSSCSADVRQDDAPIPSTTIHGEAFQVSPPPSGAAFAPTQLPQQNVHQAMLAPNNQRTEQNSSGESVVPVAGGRTKDYCDWWREHCLEQSNLSLFNVRLIGDASSPQLFTSMAHNDLAYCSKWGHNRVLEHEATAVPVVLVLPVLTKQEFVEQAVAGVLSGQISLSMSNVEAVLVLANAVGFVSLETACIDYLCVQAQKMTGDALLCLAKLADHLGLSSLLETAAEALIKLPWEENMLYLNHLLQVSLYKRDTDRRDKLLHHPQRGAYTELQLLGLLKAVDTPRRNCASAIDLESLQPSELHALLGVFADETWDSDSEALLRPALKQLMVPEALRSKIDWRKPVRIIHNLMLPERRGIHTSSKTVPLHKCDLELHIKEGQGLYLHPSPNTKEALEGLTPKLKDRVLQFTLFSMHTRAPYVRLCRTASHSQIEAAGAGFGAPNYFDILQKWYPAKYMGPFTIGVCWQNKSGADLSLA